MTQPSEFPGVPPADYAAAIAHHLHRQDPLHNVIAFDLSAVTAPGAILLSEECDLLGYSALAGNAGLIIVIKDGTVANGAPLLVGSIAANASGAFALPGQGVRVRSQLSVGIVGNLSVCTVYAAPRRSYRQG